MLNQTLQNDSSNTETPVLKTKKKEKKEKRGKKG